jgi:DNA-binding transcriptional regulator WhiA
MEINLKFEYRDLTIQELEKMLQDLQERCISKIYSITRIKEADECVDLGENNENEKTN